MPDIATYVPLVQKIAAAQLSRRLPPHVDRGDLESIGVIGLIEAAARFTPDHGASFATFAGYRIRGAILDAMRDAAPLTRWQHDRQRRTGRYEAPRVVFSTPLAAAAPHPSVAPDNGDVLFAMRIRRDLASLPAREARLLIWRFWHGLTQAECSPRLGVNKSRVSQLERRALQRLRAALKRRAT